MAQSPGRRSAGARRRSGPGAAPDDERAVEPRLSVAIVGTFDVRNYGDLLFPLLAAHRLAPAGIDVTPVSPVGGATGWDDCMAGEGMAALAQRPDRFDGLLIGGGNIAHTGPARLFDYPREMGDWAYASLWLGATLIAAIANRPVVWNAPGVPRPFEREELEKLVGPCVAASEYVSVRDEASRDLLDPAHRHGVEVVPDTACELARLWPRDGLTSCFAALLERKGHSLDRGAFVVHAKLRALPAGPEPVAALIDAHSARTGLVPLLVAIGQCHDDQVAVRRIARLLRTPSILLDDPLGLREIAAAIAHADHYVGCSLHGYVTAAAYGRAGRIVGQPAMAKQAGLLAHLGRPGDLAPNWASAFETIAADPAPSAIPDAVHARLDAHWARVVQALRQPRRGLYEDRTRFLRAVVALGLGHDGWTWLRPAIG